MVCCDCMGVEGQRRGEFLHWQQVHWQHQDVIRPMANAMNQRFTLWCRAFLND